MTLEGARLIALHISVSVASWMSHHELNQTAVSYSIQFLTNADTSVAVTVLARNLRIYAKCRSSK